MESLSGQQVKTLPKNKIFLLEITGNTALQLVKDMGLQLSADNRILMDSQLRVLDVEDVYALGDCAVSQEKPLAMLAQVANQQGKYLAKVFNTGHEKPFSYIFMGSMAQLGTWQAVADLNGPTVTV